MAENIGKWSATATLDASGFTSGTQKLVNESNRIKEALKSTFESLGAGSAAGALTSFSRIFGSGVGSLAGGLVGIGESMRSMSTHAVAAASAQRALQFQFGMTAQSAADFLTFARLSGLENGQAISALQNFLRHLGEAEQSETAARAFERLGLSIRELSEGDPGAAIARIGDALQGVQNPAERMALAHQILGREWRELMPMLLQGSEGLQRAHEHSRALSDEELRSLRALNMEIRIAREEWSQLVVQVEGWIARRWREISGLFRGEYTGPDPLGRNVGAMDAEIRRRQAALRAQEPGFMPAAAVNDQTELNKAFDQAIERIRLETATLNLGADAAQRHAFEVRGLSETKLEALRREQEARARVRREQDEERQRRELIVADYTPRFNLEREVARIQRLFGANDPERNNQLARLFQNLPTLGPAPLLGALSAGSSDVGAILQESMSPQVDRMTEIKAVLEAMRDQEREGQRTREEIKDNLDDILAILNS